MLKFRTDDLIGFGLSDKNILKLKNGKPIIIDMTELGVKGKKVMIFYGKTEIDMQKELSEFITKDTKYKSDFDS